MSDEKFPDIPEPPEPSESPEPEPIDPADLSARRSGLRTILWWIAGFVSLVTIIIFTTSQCGLEKLNLPGPTISDPADLPSANQDTELELREDQLWYRIGEDKPFSGAAISLHPNGKLKSRTKVQDGAAYGLIEQWDANGTIIGILFKDEFPP